MTLHEQIKEQIEDLQSEIISRGKRIVELEAKLKMLNDPIDWYTLAIIKGSQLDKPNLYALALNKMQELYKVTEKPLSYLELSDRVELTYPNHRVLFTMEFLLDRNVKFR